MGAEVLAQEFASVENLFCKCLRFTARLSQLSFFCGNLLFSRCLVLPEPLQFIFK